MVDAGISLLLLHRHNYFGDASRTHDQLIDFIHFAANFRPDLKFTFSISSNTLPFLDLSASISRNMHATDIFYKPIHAATSITPFHTLSPDEAFHARSSAMSSFLKQRLSLYHHQLTHISSIMPWPPPPPGIRCLEVQGGYKRRRWPEMWVETPSSSAPTPPPPPPPPCYHRKREGALVSVTSDFNLVLRGKISLVWYLNKGTCTKVPVLRYLNSAPGHFSPPTSVQVRQPWRLPRRKGATNSRGNAPPSWSTHSTPREGKQIICRLSLSFLQRKVVHNRNQLEELEQMASWQGSVSSDACPACRSTSGLLLIPAEKIISMEWTSLHAIIIIILCKLHHILNYKDPDAERFSCSTGEVNNKSDRIRLYLHGDYMNINCSLYFEKKYSEEFSNILVPLYSSVGIVPSLEISNRSSTFVFNFQQILAQNISVWQLSIPREKLVLETDVFPVDEWYVKLKLYYGDPLHTADGTLLDTMREPILQWKLGREVHSSEIIPILKIAHSLKVVKRLCASDVSVLAPLFLNHKRPDAGIYLLVTKSAFTSLDDKWFDVRPVICALIRGVCNIKLLDIVLTNRHLVLLTNYGLFISQDMLFQPGKDLPRGRQLNYFRSLAISEDVIYKVQLWHPEQCFAQKTDTTEYLSITENTLQNDVKSCRYSTSPFKRWNFCFPPKNDILGIIATTWDNQRNTIIVLSMQTRTLISVWKLDKNLNIMDMKAFQEFYFPDLSFTPTGIFLYPTMYYLYVYGSQIWYSKDGGNLFKLLIKLKNDYVIKAVACPQSYDVIFITTSNIIYYTKPGLSRYAIFNSWKKEKLAFTCDHLASLMKIFLDEHSPTGLMVEVIDHKSLITNHNAGFSRPLALQYLTRRKVLFFEHVSWIEDEIGAKPMLSFSHVGKLLKLSLGGKAEIIDVYEQNENPYFLAVAIAKILVPFYTEPFHRRILSNKLLIVNREHVYHLELLDADYGFVADDFEKTLVIPGISSFLIVRVNSSNLVIAHATMPELTVDYLLIEERQWFIYDFRSNSGTWSIVENECTTHIVDPNNVQLNPMIFLDINDTVKLNLKSKSSNAKHSKKFEVSIGNPVLLYINTEIFWDDFGFGSLNLVITSNFNVRGYTTVSISIPEASLLCPVVSIPVIVYCTCPFGKMILYKEPMSISSSEWLNGNPKNQRTEATLLKTLPVNYRPPSKLGINVPITDNIYNADPSKPKFRDFYKSSKETGRYKQCAGKQSSQECGCTEAMRLSSFIEYSDCRQRVFRVLYPASDLGISLMLRKSKEQDQILSSPFFVTIKELNNRTSWRATSTIFNPSFSKLRQFFEKNLTIYNPQELVISLFGSELYHFRITAIPGVSLCDLFTEFQIYVDEPPMAYPFQYLVSMITATVLGAIIMFYFLLQHYHCTFNIISPCWRFGKK
ncbi:cation channel sperm-associated auxiliary subunit beta-like [Narcine bancroftii]|uniref:cation channel sperm-associated auxiliary subunit beta-like n=1 Tax=Narcine bancroftii TaxID=1343680 RepID=UPI0038319225